MALLLPFLIDEPVCRVSVEPLKILSELLHPFDLNNNNICRSNGKDIRGPQKNRRPVSKYTVEPQQQEFQAMLDVAQFQTEEITVRVTGENILTIEAQHQDKETEQGSISRHFISKYIVPKEYDMSKIQCKMSPDGILNIKAPVKKTSQERKERTVTIEQSKEAVTQEPNVTKEE